MNRTHACYILTLITAFALTGCGRPPSDGGGPPPGEYSVQAVVSPVMEESVNVAVNVVGSLQARDSLHVVSEMNASVVEILFTDGQQVKQGDVLVRLDDVKLKARLAETKARRSLAETNYKRGRDLFDSQTISQQEFDQAKAEFDVADAGYQIIASEVEDTVIKAPFDGVVGSLMISPGEYLTVGSPVTHLVRLDPLEAGFRIPERYISQVKKGQPVIMRSVAMPGIDITGEIFFIDPVIDESTRTVMAKALIPNPEQTLKPGLFGKLEVVLEQHERALVIPESSVRYAGDQASVVVMNADGKAEFRDITVGLRMPGKVEVIEGLTAGERVVVEGYQKMGPGTGIIISPASAKYGITPPPPPETPAEPVAEQE